MGWRNASAAAAPGPLTWGVALPAPRRGAAAQCVHPPRDPRTHPALEPLRTRPPTAFRPRPRTTTLLAVPALFYAW